MKRNKPREQRVNKVNHFLSLLGLSLLLTTVSAAADPVATLSRLEGVASVVHANGRAALVYDGFKLVAGDTITTEKSSSVLLTFEDKSQVALRPGTQFQVKEFNYQEAQPEADSSLVKLIKGGLRTLSGFVGKRGNRDAYRLEAANATIGIRGTDFSARLCEADCDAEQKQRQAIQPSPSGLIGRIAEIEGRVARVDAEGRNYELGKSAPFFEGDELRMGDTGHATLVMTDKTRIVLQAGASMKMSKYTYDQAKPDLSNMLVEMLRGTARIATGLLGKARPRNVNFQIATATIGIRGTAFDIVCGKKDKDPCEGELYVNMREGKTEISSGANVMELTAGQTAHIDAKDAAPKLIEETPAFIRDNPLPIPERQEIDMDGLFGTGKQDVPPGLYVTTNDGRIELTEGTRAIEVSKGESSATTGTGPILLPSTPAFMDNDKVLAKFPFVFGLCGAH